MTDWTRLTDEPFFSADGHIISVLGNEAELIAMGDGLRNGLGLIGGGFSKTMRASYMDKAAKGNFQVLQVNAPDGTLVATSRLFVADKSTQPYVATRFMRGMQNVDIQGGTPASQSVGEYLQALNTGAIPSLFQGGSFPRSAEPAPQPEVEAIVQAPAPQNAWQAAMDAARRRNEAEPDVSKHITPAMALARGLGRFTPPKIIEDVLDEVKVVEAQGWPTPVENATYGEGITFEMTSCLEDINFLGGELENQYFLPNKAEEGARDSKKGGYLVAAVLLNGSVMAMAEYKIYNGSVILNGLTGYGQEMITSGPFARAAVQFGRDLTAGTVPGQVLFAMGNGFSAEAGVDFELTNDEPEVPRPQTLIQSMEPFLQHNGHHELVDYNAGHDEEEDNEDEDEDEDEDNNDEDNNDEEDDEDEDNNDEEDDEVVQDGPINWSPLINDTFHAYNGLTIKIASTTDSLMQIGQALNNPLSNNTTAERYARVAQEGLAQHYAVFSGEGNMVGCGCLLPSYDGVSMHGQLNGHPVTPFGAGTGNPANAAVNIAVSQLVTALNRGDIQYKGITGGRFNQDQPVPEAGYGY